MPLTIFKENRDIVAAYGSMFNEAGNDSGYYWPKSKADKAAAKRGKDRPTKPINKQDYEQFKKTKSDVLSRLEADYKDNPEYYPKSFLKNLAPAQKEKDPSTFVKLYKRLTGATNWDLPDELFTFSAESAPPTGGMTARSGGTFGDYEGDDEFGTSDARIVKNLGVQKRINPDEKEDELDEKAEKIACLDCDEVNTKAAWKKNKGFCPSCNKSTQGVKEAFGAADVKNLKKRQAHNWRVDKRTRDRLLKRKHRREEDGANARYIIKVGANEYVSHYDLYANSFLTSKNKKEAETFDLGQADEFAVTASKKLKKKTSIINVTEAKTPVWPPLAVVKDKGKYTYKVDGVIVPKMDALKYLISIGNDRRIEMVIKTLQKRLKGRGESLIIQPEGQNQAEVTIEKG